MIFFFFNIKVEGVFSMNSSTHNMHSIIHWITLDLLLERQKATIEINVNLIMSNLYIYIYIYI